MRKGRVREILEKNGYLVTGKSNHYGDVADNNTRIGLAHMTNPAPNFLKRWFHNSAKLVLYKHHPGGQELEEVLIREGIPYDIVSPGVF